MNERRAHILHLVAEDYIRTAHPVASSHIAERLDLSSATVRNEFGSLEEAGFLHQPHTSAGRIPTPLGFHAYAVRCLPPRRLPKRQRALIEQQLAAVGGDTLFSVLARVASDLAGYAVVIHLPADDTVPLHEIHLSMLSSRKLLAVIVLENGLVRQLLVDLEPAPSGHVLDDAERNLRRLTVPLAEVPGALRDIAGRSDEELGRTLRAVAEAWPGLNPPRVFREGLRHLLAEPESQDPEFVRLVVEQVDLASPTTGASDAPLELELDDALARVTATFEAGGARGSLTVVGPARMRYPAAMMIAHGASEVLSSGLQSN